MIPGAMCTLLLADLGADVVKVEAPGFGDGNRRGFGFEAAHVAMNRGKRSLALDLRPTGAAAAPRPLVGWADVVVESHPPGKIDAEGLVYRPMLPLHPPVVLCSIPASGRPAPHAAPGAHPPPP